MIKLFEEGERNFNHNGLGVLTDAISCVVRETINGEYELELTYPIDGIHFSEITEDRIIYTKPNRYDPPQPFKIYDSTKTLNKMVVFNAYHISYETSGIVIDPQPMYSVMTSPQVVCEYINTNAANDNPFTISSTVDGENKEMEITKPATIRQLMSSDKGRLLEVYGGEYKYDKFSISHVPKRGEDRGFKIRYGKNLTDSKIETDVRDMYTGIYPYWYVIDDGYQHLDDKIIPIPGNWTHSKILPLDLTSSFEHMPTQDELRSATLEYINANKLDQPNVSTTVSFQEENLIVDTGFLEKLELGDTVTIIFEAYNVKTTARCTAYEYDAITELYTGLTIGGEPSSITSAVANASDMQSQLDSKINNTIVNVVKASDSIKTEVSRATSEEGLLRSSIIQTAEEIRSEVSASKDALNSTISQTASEIRAEVANADAGLSTRISQNASDINLRATYGDVQSAISVAFNEIVLSSSHIRLEGLTTINGGFSIDTNGSMSVQNGYLDNCTFKNMYYMANEGTYPLFTGTSYNSIHCMNSSMLMYMDGTLAIDIGNLLIGKGSGSYGKVALSDHTHPDPTYAATAGTAKAVDTGYLTMSSGTIQAPSGSLWIGQNTVKANKIEELSTASVKQNIRTCHLSGLNVVLGSQIRMYEYKNEPDIERIGLVVEESDSSIVSDSGDSIDLYAMISMAYKAIQEQQDMIRELQNEVNVLKLKEVE